MWVWKTSDPAPRGAVVIVHGAGEHHGRYEWLKNKWLDAGFHVVIGDLPGQGSRTKHPGHIDNFNEYITTIQRWADKARSFGLPWLLLGHSLGGLSVIRTLQETRLKPHAVVLSSPCLGLVVPPPNWVKNAIKPFNILAPKLRITIKKSADNQKATRNQAVLSKDADDPFIVKKVSVRWYYELDQAMTLAFQRSKQFPNVPLFILQAGDDKIVDKHAVYRWFRHLSLQNKHYKEWTGFYHEIFNEPEREKAFNYTLKSIQPFFLTSQ